jgi:hypothetical protein
LALNFNRLSPRKQVRPPKFMRIQNNHVVITGGAGLVGSHIGGRPVASGAGRAVTDRWRKEFSVTAQLS